MRTPALLLALTFLVAACVSGEGADSSPTAGSTPSSIATTSPATTTTEPEPPWPALPDWVRPGIAYFDAYRNALASGDVGTVFPFFDEDISWFDDLAPESRTRFGLRETVTRLVAAPLTDVRHPGPLFIGFAPLPDQTYISVHWPHRVGDRIMNLHLVLARDGISRHRATGHLATAVGGAAPDLMTLVAERYQDIAVRFSSGDAAVIAGMITDRDVYVDLGDGMLEPVNPRREFQQAMEGLLREFPGALLSPLTLADLGLGDEEAAVFYTPGVANPWWDGEVVGGTGFYLFDTRGGTGTVTVAIDWVERDGSLIGFDFYFDSSAIGAIEGAVPPAAEQAWPRVPGPIRTVTGSVMAGDATVTLYNATPEHRDLVDWGLGRFNAAGLVTPVPSSIGFPPDVSCVLYAGLAIDTGAGVDLQLCFAAEELCTGAACVPSIVARSTLLHELGHVWTTQHLADEARDAFLEFRGLDEWSGIGLTRDESGAEHAAEILAWGLLDTDSWDARLPNNSCEDLAAAFRILTGKDPLQTCD